MPGYTYGDYVYFKNMTDEPKEHHIHMIFNKNPNFNITSLSKLMDYTVTSLPKLFVDEMIKKWMNSDIKVVSQLSKVVKRNKENQGKEKLYIAREKGKHILSYVD